MSSGTLYYMIYVHHLFGMKILPLFEDKKEKDFTIQYIYKKIIGGLEVYLELNPDQHLNLNIGHGNEK